MDNGYEVEKGVKSNYYRHMPALKGHSNTYSERNIKGRGRNQKKN